MGPSALGAADQSGFSRIRDDIQDIQKDFNALGFGQLLQFENQRQSTDGPSHLSRSLSVSAYSAQLHQDAEALFPAAHDPGLPTDKEAALSACDLEPLNSRQSRSKAKHCTSRSEASQRRAHRKYQDSFVICDGDSNVQVGADLGQDQLHGQGQNRGTEEGRGSCAGEEQLEESKLKRGERQDVKVLEEDRADWLIRVNSSEEMGDGNR